MDAKTNEELVAEYQAGDNDALAGLYKNNLGMIVRFAQQQLWKANTHEFEDLIQVGFLGMVKAADKFDATLGWKFISYAGTSIYQSISRAARTDTLVKIPTNYTLVPKRYREDYERAQNTVSNTSSNNKGGSQYVYEPHHTEQSELAIIKREELQALRAAIERLSDRQRHVIDRRYYHDETLSAVSKGMGVTRERVRQIQVQATIKLQEMLG